MIEVLWHGRGGQGAFTAARLLGAAASLEEGRFALAFPSFGPERRGAPMRAFTKMSDGPIGDRSAITQADFVVYLDETLLAEGWERELKPGGLVLVNSAKSAEAFGDKRIVSLDADGISTRFLGRPIPNTVVLGALCALCDSVDERSMAQAVRAGMPPKLHGGNLAIVAAAADAVRAMVAGAEVERADQMDLVDLVDAARTVPGEIASGIAGDAADEAPVPVRRPCLIPALADEPLPSWSTFADNTCFTAGHLVDTNAGWRNIRPLISSDACTGCLQCYLYCPDGAIFKTGASAKDAGAPFAPVAVDYDFCKGCGVCVTVCSFGALSMVPEHGDGAVPEASSASAPGGAASSPLPKGGAR